MCGLAGLLAHDRRPDVPIESIARRMADALVHRGPDDYGVWTDNAAGIALAHRRLAIVDLSAAGHQPMTSASGRYVIVFNGEMYNHVEVRAQLDATDNAPSWRGHSDTEVLLSAIERWGLNGALERAVGMFALALWDKQERSLLLACDRLGEKPLYYGDAADALVFGSELKALRKYPGFDGIIDRDALALYMRHNYVPGPRSIFQNVRKLMPGTFVRMCSGTKAADAAPEVYWSLGDVAARGLRDPFRDGEHAAREELERLLSRSIAGQMVADVPLGAFLSGGVDSSTVVALMQAQSLRPIKTFTIGFHESEFNEAQYAKDIAKHLGTEHTELYVTPREALQVIPRLPVLFDEPFADSSQIPTFLVAELARQHVTVSLSGDAGDELFGGYNRYFWARRLWRRIATMPDPVRRSLAATLTRASPSQWNKLFRVIGPVIPGRYRVRHPGEKIRKLASFFGATAPERIYLDLVSHWEEPANLVLNSTEPRTPVTDPTMWLDAPEFESRMMFLDSITYLPFDILVKVDRAAMGVSLETRVPMLDHRLVEFAWRLPLEMKMRSGEGKWLLRQVLYSYVPRRLIDRPKMGFGVPIGEWIRGPLREWAEALLDEGRLAREGVLHTESVRRKWNEHLSGQRDWQYHLWDVLAFQAWHETWASSR